MIVFCEHERDREREREQLWLVSNTILAFAWRDWGEPQKNPMQSHLS
jgi:hypothetical protein